MTACSKQSSPAVKADVYTRISSDPSGQRAGVERQRADCQAHCLARDAGGGVTFRCLGKYEGLGRRFLDGWTHEGTAGLAANTSPPASGTRWELSEVENPHPDVEPGRWVHLRCLGDAQGPRFLDGCIDDRNVGLAPHTGPPFMGTLRRMLSPAIWYEPAPTSVSLQRWRKGRSSG